jgi:hypothetical protein
MAPPKKQLPANAFDVIAELAGKGVFETKIVEVLGISYKTWLRLKSEDPAVGLALRYAKALDRDDMVSQLRKQAEEGNLTALIFYLKSVHGFRDRGDDNAPEEQRVKIKIELPDSPDADSYKRLRAQGRVPLPVIDATPVEAASGELSGSDA